MFHMLANKAKTLKIKSWPIRHLILGALFTWIHMHVNEMQDRKFKLMQFCLPLHTKVQI